MGERVAQAGYRRQVIREALIFGLAYAVTHWDAEKDDVDDRAGDLALQARRALVKLALGDQELGKEALEGELEGMWRELAGPDPTPLERLLGDRVVACWQQVSYADAMYAQNVKDLGLRMPREPRDGEVFACRPAVRSAS